MQNEQLLNTITNVDCLDLCKSVSSSSIDLIIIDPPYITTNQAWDQRDIITESLVDELFRIAKESCSLYCWCGVGENSQSLMRWFPVFQNKWRFKDLITWKKKRGIGHRKGWLYTREESMWFVKDNSKFIWNKENQYSDEKQECKFGFSNLDGYTNQNDFKRITNVWTDIPEQMMGMRLHYTPKPIKAIERIILAHTIAGDTVFDCFNGSGTTCVAAQGLNRAFIVGDCSEEYCQIARKRLTYDIDIASQAQNISHEDFNDLII